MTFASASLPLPTFSTLDIEQLKQQILDLIEQGKTLLAQVQAPQQFEQAHALIEQFDTFENDFSELFGVLSHLNAVKNTSEVDGFQVFKKNCKTCHGADGSLGLNGAKDLRVSTLSIEQRIETITHGKGVMTAFETILSPEEIKAVAEYTTTLK